MADIVVTVPRAFTLQRWIEEGDLPGQPWSGAEYHFYLGGGRPHILPGDRVYIVCLGKLRGYAPLVRVDRQGRGGYSLVRRGGAVAVTLAQPVRGFQGFRYRWWDRAAEIAFADWMTP